MQDIIIRWTFGETGARSTSPQALDILDCSLKFSYTVFPDAERAICYNHVSDRVKNTVCKIAEINGATPMDVSTLLPTSLRNYEVKNSWWKYAPTRLAIGKYEIVMDNDVVLWKIPPTLLEGIQTDSLIALTDGAGQYYGDYQLELSRVGSNLHLNAGLIGMPPGYKVDLHRLDGKIMKDFFHSEQGFSAINFLEYNGNKRLIPIDEVTQLNVFDVSPDELISEYCGGHFCGCSYGHYDYWNRKYAVRIKDEISNKMKKSLIETEVSLLDTASLVPSEHGFNLYRALRKRLARISPNSRS